MYESEGLKPLLRLSWNKQDANYLATVGLDSSTTTILDIRCGRLLCSTVLPVCPVVVLADWLHCVCHAFAPLLLVCLAGYPAACHRHQSLS